MNWIKNIGIKPDVPEVHIRLNTHEYDMIDGDKFYYQDPNKWDWRTPTGVRITHYAIPEIK